MHKLILMKAALILALGLNASVAGISEKITDKKEPLRFTENKGQVRGYDGKAHPEVKFVTGKGNTQVFLMESGIAYQFTRKHYPASYHEKTNGKRGGIPNPAEMEQLQSQISTETFRMDMTLLGANPGARLSTEGRSSDYENYYSHNVLSVFHYNKITYHDIYPGIDWVIYSNGESMKYDFVIHPGADPSLIQMEFLHQEEFALNKDGSFTLKNRLGTITEQAPLSYQDGQRINTQFKLNGNRLSFNVAEYNQEKELVIDPALIWASYYGGSGNETGFSCTTDTYGNVYMAGGTDSYNMIAASGHQNNFAGGNYDAFLVKFDASGQRQWATYYGGNNHDYGYSVAVDASHNVYMVGGSNSSSGIASGGHQNFLAGSVDAFLVKFNSSGIRLWATYFGGLSYEWGSACNIDPYGEIFISGVTSSQSGIASGGHQNVYGGGIYDAFLAKFNTNGVRLWSTYYGGQGSEGGSDLEIHCATDFAGEVYLSGTTASTGSISANGHQNFIGGQTDAFLVKFGSSGIRQWATYYGGSGTEESYECATDPSGNIYLCGKTNSGSNIASGGHQNSKNLVYDAFLVKFNSSGNRQWGTYYGGGYDDFGFGCTTDAADNVYLTGSTDSYNNIATPGYNSNKIGDDDAFLAKFNPNGIRQWGFYFGGTDSDFGNAVAIDVYGDIYLSGTSASSSGLASSGSHQQIKYGYWDGFLAKFCGGSISTQPLAITGNTNICSGSTQIYSVPYDPDVLSYTWTLPSGWTGSSNTNAISIVAASGSTPVITVVANGTCGIIGQTSLYVNVGNAPFVYISSNTPTYCIGMQATLSAMGSANTYTWQDGSTTATLITSPKVTTVYSVTGSNNTGCETTATYTIIPNTSTKFTYNLSGLTAAFSITGSDCNSFIWDFGNGATNSINPNPVMTYAAAGTYGVCLKCNGLPNACLQCINITVPDESSGGVGIAENTGQAQLLFYPNPTTGVFEIETPAATAIEVINATGQVILTTQLQAGKNKIDIGKYSDGIYFIHELNNGAQPVKIIKN